MSHIDNVDGQSYVNRHLRMMSDLIADFRAGGIDYGTYVSRLESMAIALGESVDDKNLKSFYSYWIPLEEINAVMSAEGRSSLSSGEMDVACQMSDSVDQLLDQWKQSLH